MGKVKFEMQIAKHKRTCHNCKCKILKNENSLTVTVRDRNVNLCKKCVNEISKNL